VRANADASASGARRHARERPLVERVERGMAAEEVGDVVHLAGVDTLWRR
jgi:hypothetical protein